MENKRIRRALVSVFHKDGLDEILRLLHEQGVELLSTGGTQAFIESLGIPCRKVEDVTGYPSILTKYDIPEIDLVIVDLYPFEQTVASGAGEQDIIEKIDIGGISLIRATAKNFQDVVIVPSKAEYPLLADILKAQGAETSLEQRRTFACRAFGVSSHYDTAIHGWFAQK